MAARVNKESTRIDDLEDLYRISKIINQATDIKNAMDRLMAVLRPLFIFDNMVLYQFKPDDQSLDVVYARSTGRGRAAGADIAWGESIALQAVKKKSYFYLEPESKDLENRLVQAHILSIPLLINKQVIGVLVFIRYGGPKFVPASIDFATYVGNHITWLLEAYQLRMRAEALDEQHKAIQLQEDFVNTITHELRNPIGFIKGYTTTLLRQDASWDQATQHEFLQIIDQETDQLSELIENMLDSARIQSGQLSMDFQPVRINALVKDAIQKFNLHHPATNIDLQVDSDIPPIKGDPNRLAQVFENLLSNAVKYAPESKVDVICRRNPAGVEVQVRDYGQGIPEKYLPHIFERFFRVPEQSISIRGTGLGLHICKQLVEAHHGSIKVESQPGAGTTFTVLLPIPIMKPLII